MSWLPVRPGPEVQRIACPGALLCGHGRQGRDERLAQAQHQLEAACLEAARLRQALEASVAREQRARLQASRDALTGLPNRTAFEAHATRTLAAHCDGARVFGLMFIDLDGFKAINDSLGHQAGDELLRIVGARLMHGVRRGDLVSRHGGDEFLCLLPRLAGEDRALSIAQALVHAVGQPCHLAGQCVSVRPSIGIALYPRDGDSIDALVQRADEAMRCAKADPMGVAVAASDSPLTTRYPVSASTTR